MDAAPLFRKSYALSHEKDYKQLESWLCNRLGASVELFNGSAE